MNRRISILSAVIFCLGPNFARAQNTYLPEEHLAWQARAALRAGRWSQVLSAIGAMGDSQRFRLARVHVASSSTDLVVQTTIEGAAREGTPYRVWFTLTPEGGTDAVYRSKRVEGVITDSAPVPISIREPVAVSPGRYRVDVWLHPFGDEANTSYQIAQSLYGFASGGMFGSGLGQGFPQLVPYAKSDFIVSAFGEEIGLIGLMAILVLYGIVVERGLRTAVACRDVFGTLLAAGLAISMALQVFVVVGGVTRLIPLTGLTTPFLAQGGSSLVANWIAIALLIRISDAARRPDLELPMLADAPTQVVQR